MSKIDIRERYGTVPISILNSPLLSFKAKGVYAYIQAKPDGWDFSSKRIQNETKESIDSVQASLKELENNGLLIREKQPNNRIKYILTNVIQEKAIQEKAIQEKAIRENPVQENPVHKNTIVKENYNILEKHKKEKKEREFSPIQTDILTEEIYHTYMENFPPSSEGWKHKRPSYAKEFISSLLKTYDNAFLLSCISSYKKAIDPKWWKSPQYFFSTSTSKNAKDSFFFLNYAPTEGENSSHYVPTDEEKKKKLEDAMSFFTS